MTATVIVDDYCPRCDRTHKVQVLGWTEDGFAADVRQLEPCDPPKEAR